MPNLPDGYVLDSNFRVIPIKDALSHTNTCYSIHMGQIVEVHPVGSPRNWSSRYVEYDVLVFEDRVTMNIWRNCRYLDDFGDGLNFGEIVLKGTTNMSLDQAYQKSAEVRAGAMVLVACISGQKSQSVIIGTIQHPSWNRTTPTSPTPEFAGPGNSPSRDEAMVALPAALPGAKAEDGSRILGEYNGLRWNVNSDGELTLMFQGTKDAKGKLLNENGPTTMKFNKSGEFVVIDKLDQEIRISPVDGTIVISDGQANPSAITIQRDGPGINVTSRGNVTIHADKEINSEAQTGKNIVAGLQVFLGSATANEPLVLGNQLATLLSTLLATYTTAFTEISTGLIALGQSGAASTAAATATGVATAQIPVTLSTKVFTEKA